jgi:signal transduction histidine kinase
MCALYAIAVWTETREFLIGFAVLVAGNWLANLLGNVSAQNAFLFTVVPGAAMFLCRRAVRERQLRNESLAARAELLERERELRAHEAVIEERGRIARELHDLVAHTLTAINVQAAAAAERSREGEARGALERIEQASHSAIGELRAILGVLRTGEEVGAPRTPVPGLDSIPELIAHAREDGLDVAVEMSGEPSAGLSDAVSLAAYRIIQESLTNARRHAPGAPVRVALRFEGDRMALAVENPDGAEARNGNGPGVGIRGMTERATAVGGTVEAEPVAGGFRVRAELPYAPRA